MRCRPVLALPRPLARLAALGLLLLTALGLLAAPAGAAGLSSRPIGLSPAEQRTVLDLVDAICGDTWCEGDHAFDFRGFTCDTPAGTCVLRLRIARSGEEPLRWYVRSGTVTGFTRFSQMVETSASGHQSLAWPFYEALSEVVGEIEASVPAPRRR